ncbi:MAG: BlaI/MecI/CopY family transcriptional regulator [Saprospiraceae bacterium]
MTLNNLEEEIMQIFWKLGKAFPKEIIAYLHEPQPPYNTVLSTIRKLEKEGWLSYRVFGKSHQYYPIIEQKQFNKSVFSKFFQKLLNGDRSKLLSYFMEEEDIDIKELESLVKSLKNKP